MPTDLRRRDDFGVGGRAGPVQSEHLLDLRADAEDRIERGARLLENIADHPAADVAQPAFRGAQNIHAVKQNCAAGIMGGRLRQKPGDGQGGGAFAAAAFADQTKCFARRDGKGNAVNRAQPASAGGEINLQIGDFQQVGEVVQRGMQRPASKCSSACLAR